ncbi:MAG: inositol 2-dehydrogenase [Anaerolineales bacterium]|nr:inositol 2-dehydrogenase [Anaerolineales bacterium]
MTIRLGLIGAGRMGQVFAEHVAYHVPGAILAAVADVNAARASEVARRYGAQASYAHYADLLARDDIDAVLVITPSNTHVEVVKAAAAAGKHIFCEKPLALTVAGCEEAITATEAAKVKLYIGFMRRFDAAYRAAKQQIEAGVIGRPVMFKAVGRDSKRTDLEYARRENSGGLLLDMGIHDFDLARWLMGSEVTRVHTEGGCLVYAELSEVGDIDNAVVNLRFASGAVGNVDVSRNAVYGYDIRTEVLGSEGALMIGKLQQTAILTLTRKGVQHDTIPYFMERFGEAYAEEIRDFVACVREDRPPTITGYDARAATAIGVAATRSLDEGRPVWVSEELTDVGKDRGTDND